MNSVNRNTPIVLGIGIFFVALLLAPWVFSSAFAPLRPEELALTVTAYFPTEAAFLTRDAEAEMRATSAIELLPTDPQYNNPTFVMPTEKFEASLAPTITLGTTENTSNSVDTTFILIDNTNGVANLTTQNSDSATTHIAIVAIPSMNAISAPLLQAFNAPMTITTTAEVETFYCPSAIMPRGEHVEPDITLSVLGYWEDIAAKEETVYFLIIHNSPEDQVWIQYDRNNMTVSTNYREIFSSQLSCGAVPNQTGTSVDVTLPLIATATNLPPVQETLTVREADAEFQISHSVPEIRDATVTITHDHVTINGLINLDLPLGTILEGEIEIVGTLVLEGRSLRMDVESATVAGINAISASERQQIETAIDQWLKQLLVRRDVLSLEMMEGQINLDTLRYFNSRDFETQLPIQPPSPTRTPSSFRATYFLTAEPTDTQVSLVVVTTTPLPILTRTPLPIRTATPTPTRVP